MIVDYIWLSLGFFGLVTAATDITKNISAGEYKLEIWRFERWYEETSSYAESKAQLFHNLSYYEQWQFNRDEIPKHKEAVIWFDNLVDSLRKGYKSNAGKNFYKTKGFVNQDEPDFIAGPKKEMIMDLKDLFEMDKDISKYQSESNERWYESMLSFFSPFFLALALSLRITKVTAELLRDRQITIYRASNYVANKGRRGRATAA
ncbi:MAG: hypothetical protein ACREBU_25690 [Nitrososphaera sp.]